MRRSVVHRSLLVASAFLLASGGEGCGSSAPGGKAGAGGKGGASGGGGASVSVGGAGASGAAGSGGDAGAAGASGGAVVGIGGRGGAGSGGGGGGVGGDPVAGTGGAAGSGGAGGGSIPFYPLDMNDVTILAPLPQSLDTPVLLRASDSADDGTVFVPRALFDRLVKNELLSSDLYASIQLVAVRFDLCDRHLPGACPEAEDARLRLVFQPISAGPLARDVGFHAFYAIRNDEITAAVTALRDLARSVPAQTGALRVSPALSAADPSAYATALRAFVKRYGGEARLVRLTVNMQPETAAAIRWTLRGVEKQGDAFVDITIAGTTDVTEAVLLNGDPGYSVTPAVDIPAGLSGAISATTFASAEVAQKRAYLAALAAADNPLTNTAETVPCVACHVSTVVMSARAATSAIDPLALPGRYTSKFDLSVAGGMSTQTSFTIRALGYVAQKPLISQRVVNDTAQTLTEIEARFPPP